MPHSIARIEERKRLKIADLSHVEEGYSKVSYSREDECKTVSSTVQAIELKHVLVVSSKIYYLGMMPHSTDRCSDK